MAPARVAAYIGGTTLLIAWLSSAAGIQPAPDAPREEEPRPEAARLDALAAGVQAQSARLRAKLAAAPAARTGRNPFAFESAAPAARPRQAAAAPEPEAEPDEPSAGPSAPALVLLGVAEQDREGTVRRTAMIAGPGDQLFMVAEGEALAGRYRVGAVSADAVELVDLATGATRRLGPG